MINSTDGLNEDERPVSASELRRHQGRLLFEVQTEATRLVVLRYGHPVAAIVPLDAVDKHEENSPAPHL